MVELMTEPCSEVSSQDWLYVNGCSGLLKNLGLGSIHFYFVVLSSSTRWVRSTTIKLFPLSIV